MKELIRKKILICTSNQFGYLTDTYKYCEYAKDLYDITFICWDYNRKRYKLDNVTVHYVSRQGNIIKRNIRLLKFILSEIRQESYDKAFIVYIRGITILKLLLPRAPIILDVRTASIHSTWLYRVLYNTLLKFESLFFNQLSVISAGVAKKLLIKNYTLLPLGGEDFKVRQSTSHKIRFLYVGALQGRDILSLAKAFYQFSNETNDFVHLKIIGDAENEEGTQIKQFLKNTKSTCIDLIGWVSQNELANYFEDSDIGVCYVPIVPWFEYQPPTKTFEYLVSGLPMLATATYENKKLIEDYNGVLVEDNIQSVVKGLHNIKERFLKNTYDQNIIKGKSILYKWENIVLNNFTVLINEG